MFITNTDRVRAELESQIVAGTLQPGTTLDEAQLGQLFEVSRTPVREALLQLAAEGFVRIVPRAGIYVVQLSAGELAEMFEALSYAEGLCAQLASQRITAAQIKKLSLLQKKGQQALADQDMGAYAQYNLEFHECVYGCCGHRYLRSQKLYIRKRTNPYRKQQAELTMEWAGQAWDEHQLLFEALVDRNAEAAMQAAAGHIKARSRDRKSTRLNSSH